VCFSVPQSYATISSTERVVFKLVALILVCAIISFFYDQLALDWKSSCKAIQTLVSPVILVHGSYTNLVQGEVLTPFLYWLDCQLSYEALICSASQVAATNADVFSIFCRCFDKDTDSKSSAGGLRLFSNYTHAILKMHARNWDPPLLWQHRMQCRIYL